MKTAYTYTILRYVHDVAAGESLNVGVVLYAPAVRYVGARLQTKYSRLRQAFPMLDGEAHRRLMRYLQARFDELQVRFSTELPFDPQPERIDEVVCFVLPKDDSSLQWSQAGGGLTTDPEAELGLSMRGRTANGTACSPFLSISSKQTASRIKLAVY